MPDETPSNEPAPIGAGAPLPVLEPDVPRAHLRFALALLGVFAVVILTAWAPAIWLYLLPDGLLTALLIVAAAGLGAWPAHVLLSGDVSRLQRGCVATAIGLGLLAAVTFVLGASGVLDRTLAWVVVAAGLGCGMSYLGQARKRQPAAARLDRPAPRRMSGIWLPIVLVLPLSLPLAVMLFGATLPPGLLWEGEAYGYDVLEYHLQVPREYFDAGVIQFLPHNVYASFPAQVETLYLLLMHLCGDAHAAAIPAQLLHAMLGILTAVALYAFAPSGPAGLLAALTAGCVPWLAYLGCLAYVELGVTFFAAVTGGLLLQTVWARDASFRHLFAAGLCAGLAGGCKYTALVLVALAALASWLIVSRTAIRQRLLGAVAFTVGCVVAFSPWLARNAVFTGNPIYPFAYEIFGGAGWSAERASQWEAGHAFKSGGGDVGLAGRLGYGFEELIKKQMFGVALFGLAAVGVWRVRDRRSGLLLLWVVLMLLSWAILTHMPGRFVVPLVVPLGFLSGYALIGRERRSVESELPPGSAAGLSRVWLAAIVVIAVAGAFVNDFNLYRLLRYEYGSWTRRTAQDEIALDGMLGQTQVLLETNDINRLVGVGSAKVWLIGLANVFYITPETRYTVVFNRDPWLEFAEDEPDPGEVVAWLRTQKVTHVVFSWTEIERLRRTYGFSPLPTPAWIEGLTRRGLRRIWPESGPVGRGFTEVYRVDPPMEYPGSS